MRETVPNRAHRLPLVCVIFADDPEIRPADQSPIRAPFARTLGRNGWAIHSNAARNAGGWSAPHLETRTTTGPHCHLDQQPHPEIHTPGWSFATSCKDLMTKVLKNYLRRDLQYAWVHRTGNLPEIPGTTKSSVHAAKTLGCQAGSDSGIELVR